MQLTTVFPYGILILQEVAIYGSRWGPRGCPGTPAGFFVRQIRLCKRYLGHRDGTTKAVLLSYSRERVIKMKKWVLIALACLITLALLLTFVHVLSFVQLRRAEVAVLDMYSVRFGDRPAAAIGKMGQPVDFYDDMEISSKTRYEFEAPVFGYDAAIGCYFFKDRSLSQVCIDWECQSEMEAKTLAEQIKQHIQAKCGQSKNFHIEENPDKLGDHYAIIKIDDGATGIFYYVDCKDTIVSVTAINLY